MSLFAEACREESSNAPPAWHTPSSQLTVAPICPVKSYYYITTEFLIGNSTDLLSFTSHSHPGEVAITLSVLQIK